MTHAETDAHKATVSTDKQILAANFCFKGTTWDLQTRCLLACPGGPYFNVDAFVAFMTPSLGIKGTDAECVDQGT